MSIAFFRNFDELRGELHDIYDEIRSGGDEARTTFESLDKEIRDTWAEVEAAAARHGVTSEDEAEG